MPINRLSGSAWAFLAAAIIAIPTFVFAGSNDLQTSREQLYKALVASNVFSPAREIVHLSHACSLQIDGDWYPVVDLNELVKGAVVPRGANTIIVLDPKFRPLHKIDYATERPLFCLKNELFVFGDLTIDGVPGTGNVLEFSQKGKKIILHQIEANDLPIPPTDKRPAPVQ